MAEIEMERRPRRRTWVWALAALLVIAIAIGAWFLFASDAARYDVRPAAERPGVPEPVPEQPYEYTEPAPRTDPARPDPSP